MKTSRPRFDETQAILDILTALEYGTKKQENAIVVKILKDPSQPPPSKSDLALALLKQPGFEDFFLEILSITRPFALMLAEIYEFLNSNEATTSRRASKFLVQSDKAKAKLEFDLQNFPKQLIKVLSQTDFKKSVMELRFPGIDLSTTPAMWDDSGAKQDWAAVAPRWDGNFYDEGFHSALVYAHTILAGDAEATEKANTIVQPILERLAAISEFAASLTPLVQLSGRIESFYGVTPPLGFEVQDFPARSYVVRDPAAPTYLNHLVSPNSFMPPTAIKDLLASQFQAFAIANTLWRRTDVRINEQKGDPWAIDNFGTNLSDVTPAAYLELLERLATDYSAKLDKVAPIVDTLTYQTTVESLLEFLTLPFWKHRWFLYELWTLTEVLKVAERVGVVRLNNLTETHNQIVEWKLPGGMARDPVAIIGEPPKQVYCWTQRKTYHPETRAGLEPDLRLTTSNPAYHDLIIIENKDRLTASKTALAEIMDRYIGGTCAESVWLINYETFTDSTMELEKEWPGRRLRIVSHFKPGELPDDFEPEIERVLKSYLDTQLLQSTEESGWQEVDVNSDLFEVVLTWKETPRDLDLHAWFQSATDAHHVCFRSPGTLDSLPYAQLCEDQTQGNGKETLRIKPQPGFTTVIAVKNFSAEAPFSLSGAILEINFGNRTLQFKVPEAGEGTWWHVGTFKDNGRSAEVLQKLSEEPPIVDGV
jgi:hypothetical protein